MRPWTSRELCAMAQIVLSHRIELLALDPEEPVASVLERINAMVPDEPKVMLLNARVETDLGLLEQRTVEGAVPPEGDDDFHPLYRLVYGRTEAKIGMLPYFPNQAPETREYRSRITAILDGLKDGTHPSIRRGVVVPTVGTRTYAAVTFYVEHEGPRAFARFAWRKDMREEDAVWLLKDAWTRWHDGQLSDWRPQRGGLPS